MRSHEIDYTILGSDIQVLEVELDPQETVIAEAGAGTTGIRRIAVGKYRDWADPMQIVSGPIGHDKVHYEAPPSSEVPKEMRRFLDWWEESRSEPEGDQKSADRHLGRGAGFVELMTGSRPIPSTAPRQSGYRPSDPSRAAARISAPMP